LATFREQVESLTSLSVSTTPTVLELDQFLIDGVIDVTNRWLVIHPEDRELFMDETGLQVAQGANLDGADIISVVRADGITAGNFRPCRKISQAQQSQVLDTESLSFASKYYPVYMLNSDNSVAVFPVPSDNSGLDSYKIYYVNNTPLDGTGNSLTSADNTLRSFPADKVYLVVLYASIKTVGAVMGNSVISLTSVPPDVPTLSTVSFSETNSLSITATTPTAISLTTVDYTGLSSDEDTGSVDDVTPTTVDISGATQPAYNGNAVVGLADGTLTVEMVDTPLSVTDLTIKAVPPDVPSLTSISYNGPGASDAELTAVAAGSVLGSTTQPSYDTSVADTAIALVTSKIAAASTFTSTNEDVELAASKLSEVGAVINDANLRIQDQLNIFNEENIKYQASVQESMAEFQSQNQINLQNASNSNNRLLQNAVQDAKVVLDNNAQAIQKYQTEIAEYQAEVNTEVQEWQANTTKDLQVWQQINAMALQEHSARMQDALNLFNEENVEYQAEVQEKVQQAQILNQESIQNMQKALQIAIRDADKSQEHQVQEKIQDMQAIIADNQRKITQYQAEASHYATQVNEDVQAYTSQLQGDVQQMQAIIADNQNLLAKYQAEISEYQAEVATETQEQSIKMQQYQLLYNQLKAEYDQAFMIAAPKQQAEA